MASRPSDAARQPSEVAALARCHRLCLPNTASSRAGLAVLEALYAAQLTDPAARVIWHPGEPAHEGAFAAGTIAFRSTEAHTRRALGPMLFARLALHVAAMPRHVLARRRWETLIPRSSIGYVLTLGSARSVVPASRAQRGGPTLAELEVWFSENACVEIWTDTELSNQRAHAFYLRNGYVEVDRSFGQVLLRKSL